jgi:hypothetical protein
MEEKKRASKTEGTTLRRDRIPTELNDRLFKKAAERVVGETLILTKALTMYLDMLDDADEADSGRVSLPAAPRGTSGHG